MLKINQTDYHTEINVELIDSNQIYEIMDILKAGSSHIKAIDHQEPNMEEIFLNIVKGGKK